MTPQTAITACCMMLIGAGLYFGPDSVTERVRGPFTDLLRPGLNAVRLARESIETTAVGNLGWLTSSQQPEIAQLENSLAIAEENQHALKVRLAQLSEQRLRDQGQTPEIPKSQPLFQPTLMDVAVLGSTLSEEWRAGKLLDKGEKSGLREKEWILKSKRTLIDAGDDYSISTEDALLLGRSVIGKVEHVGRWTSTIQLVTDPKFSGRAQLIRKTSEGLYVFEAREGIILRGQGGPLCRLEGIPADCSVHVNDAVFTKERDGLQATPLYYGKVVAATLEANDAEWKVLVEPARLPSQLTRVQVLRMTVNSERLVSR